MKRISIEAIAFYLLAGTMLLAGCGSAQEAQTSGAPPPLRVETAGDPNVFRTDHPEQFPLTAVVAHEATSALRVTGTVTPDISRTVPVVSLATGRVVEVDARLGDSVTTGQLLLRVQSADIAAAKASRSATIHPTGIGMIVMAITTTITSPSSPRHL